MKVNQRPTSRTSPERDPVLLAIQAACLVLAAVAAVLIVRLVHDGPAAAAPIFCPAPDHPMWAASIHQWICGESLTVGVKSR